MSDDARFVGAVAAFRDIRNSAVARARCRRRGTGLTVDVERARVVLSRGATRHSRCLSFNKVVWSEGLFLRPQHFQQQDRYFERYVETRCQALVAAQLGLHRARARARLPEHRQVRRCGARPACFPTARRSGCRRTIRCRRRSTSAQARDQIVLPGGAAAPAGAPDVDRVAGRRRAGRATRCASWRRATRHRVRVTRRCSRSARCARGCCSRARSRRRMRACRSRTSSSAAPTSRSCSTTRSFRRCSTRARRTGWHTFITELLGLLHQRGDALGGRVAATGRGAVGRDRRLPDAAGDQPLRAAARALRRLGRAASRGPVPRSACRRRASWRRSRRRRSGRRSSPPIGTSACASRSSR